MTNFKLEIKRGINERGREFVIAILTTKDGEIKKYDILRGGIVDRQALTCDMLKADGFKGVLKTGDLIYKSYFHDDYFFKYGDSQKIFYWNDIDLLNDDLEKIAQEIKKRYNEVKEWIESIQYEEKIVVFDFDNFIFKIEKNEIKTQIEYTITASNNNKNIYEKRFFVKDDEILYILPTKTQLNNKHQIRLLEKLQEEFEDEIIKQFATNEIEYIKSFEDEDC